MKRILCLGDSNTYGYDPRSYFGSRYPADVRWTGRLRGMGWEVVECGQNGMSVPRGAQLDAVLELIRRQEALDRVAVMLGTNDLLGGASAEETASRMEALLRGIADQTRDPGIVLIAPPPLRCGEWVRDSELIDASVQLGGAYRRLAEKLGICFADAGEWGVALGFDGVHFTPEGHTAFAEGLFAALSEAESDHGK